MSVLHLQDMATAIPSRTDILDLVRGLADVCFEVGTDIIDYDDVEGASEAIGLSTPVPVIHWLRVFGFVVGPRPHGANRVRGYRCSSNDRWFGPGSSPTCGGSGGDSITGMAGRVEW